MNIYLVGFMGAGKSYVGKMIAEKFKMNFLDLDNIIEKGEKTTISSIFDNYGESYFREKELYYLHKSFEEENSVISLGGGTVCFGDNIDLVKQKGVVIYLNATHDVLYNRLKIGQNNRPLIKGLCQKDLKSYIYNTLEVRNVFYQKADVLFNVDQDEMPLIELEYLINRFK